MKRLIVMTSVFFGTLIIGSIFTGRKPFDGLNLSLMTGFLFLYYLILLLAF